MTTPADAVARELERLRNEVGQVGRDVGEIKTAVAVLVERSTRTEQDVQQLRADTEDEARQVRESVAVLDARLRAHVEEELRKLREAAAGQQVDIEALKSRRWPLETVAVLTGVGGTVIALIALFVQ